MKKEMIVYVVTMYRYGNRERHSYVCGVFTDNDEAKKWAEAEMIFRGNKYVPEITCFALNNPHINPNKELEQIGKLQFVPPTNYGSFYDKAVIALGFSSASLPSEKMDNLMLEKISDLFWAVNNLADALRVAYEKIPSHWRTPLPFSYFEIMERVKKILKTGRIVA